MKINSLSGDGKFVSITDSRGKTISVSVNAIIQGLNVVELASSDLIDKVSDKDLL